MDLITSHLDANKLSALRRDLDMIEDKAENISLQSTPQVLPSFEVYTPPVTYPEEVKATIGTSIKVELFDQTQLEDLGLNTSSPDLFLSSREVLSVDESEPQPLPNFPSLDANLGDKRGTDPPINPYIPSSFRMKVVVCMLVFDYESLHD
ncbi:hypothetical protein Tco_0806220 [Tanacetum coccineum]